MANKKASKSSKTDHVLNLLAGSSGQESPKPAAPPAREAAAPEPVQSSSSVMKVCHLLLKCSGGRAKSPVRPKTRWKDYSAKEMS